MGSLSNVNFAPYSTGGQNLKKAMGVSAMTQTREGTNMAGGKSDMLTQSLMNRENNRVQTKAAIANPFQEENKSKSTGIGNLEIGVQKTVLGGKIGSIVSKLV